MPETTPSVQCTIAHIVNILTPQQLRERVLLDRSRYNAGEITIDQLNLTVDTYIASFKALKARKRAKFKIPTRAYVLRAL